MANEKDVPTAYLGSSFVLIDIRVNGESVMGDLLKGEESGIMARMFSELLDPHWLPSINTYSPGEAIELKVKNVSSGELLFMATMIGTKREPDAAANL